MIENSIKQSSNDQLNENKNLVTAMRLLKVSSKPTSTYNKYNQKSVDIAAAADNPQPVLKPTEFTSLKFKPNKIPACKINAAKSLRSLANQLAIDKAVSIGQIFLFLYHLNHLKIFVM